VKYTCSMETVQQNGFFLVNSPLIYILFSMFAYLTARQKIKQAKYRYRYRYEKKQLKYRKLKYIDIIGSSLCLNVRS